MSRYGINYYGSAFYGLPALIDFAVNDFRAVPFGHGQIKLSWSSPTGAWNRLRLVRGTYGYPTNAFEGKELLDTYYGLDPAFYLDNDGVTEGSYYYYSLFVYDISEYQWVRAGSTSAVSVKDYKTANLLYNYVPEPYKYVTLTGAVAQDKNEDLYKFLSIFGFEIDKYRTLVSNVTKKYDLSVSDGAVLPSLLRQFGLRYEPEVGLQQSRVLVRDAVQLYKEKGSNQGIREFLKAYTGYSVPNPNGDLPNPGVNGIVVGHNLMLDYNCSSFEQSYGVWESKSNATLSALTTCNITKYSVLSNVLTLTLDRVHGYVVGDSINVSGSPVPLVNTTSPVTITAVTSTTISFAKTFYDIALTKTTGTVSPNPAPWDEPTTIIGYPNKQGGILRVSNSSASAGTVSISAAESDPIKSGIPVTAGLPYTFSVYSVGSTSRSVTLSINWHDRFGTSISVTNGTATPNGTGAFSARPTVTGTAPANSYYAVPIISIAAVGNAASGEHHHFDAAQFEQSLTATEFDEARNLHITLKASRINELPNPNFNGSLVPWNLQNCSVAVDTSIPDPNINEYNVTSYFIQSGIAEVTTSLRHEIKVGDLVNVDGVSGTVDGQHTVTVVTENTLAFTVTAGNVASTPVSTGHVHKAGSVIKLTATSTTPVSVESSTELNNLIPIYYPGSSYTFSIYTKAYSSQEVGKCKIYWYDDDSNLINEEESQTVALSTDWTPVYITGTSPENAYQAKVEFIWIPSSANAELNVDHALLENAAFLLPYFDGEEGPAANDNELFWEGGMANAARSHLYLNRNAIESRVTSALSEFITDGTTFTIYLAQPKT